MVGRRFPHDSERNLKMTGNNVMVVANLDDERSIREGEAAVERYNNARDEARAQVIPMALGLCAAKRKYPATQEFGNWLQTSPYRKIGQNDRAALIKIGEHEEFASRFIRTTSLVSPQTIWGAIEELRPSYCDSNSPNPPPALEPVVPIGESGPPSQQRRLPPGVEPAVLFTPGSLGQQRDSHSAEISGTESSKMTDRCGFADAPRAEEFHTLFRSKDARANLSRIWHGKHGRATWALMVKALDAGLVTENDRSFRTASLLLLFPSLPSAGKYDLENPEHLAYIRDHILPAMIACRDKLLANPERTKEIVNEYISGQKATEKTEDELRTEWMNDLNVMLMYILGMDEQLTSKYGYWQRWQISEQSVDRLQRAIKFLSRLIPTDTGQEDGHP